MGTLLFPARCLGCQSEGRYLCDTCVQQFQSIGGLLNGAPFLTLGEYDGLLATCVRRVKRRGQTALGRELVDRAVDQLQRRWGHHSIDAVMAVPPSVQGQKFRGFSLPAMMEEAVVDRLGWRPVGQPLRRLFPVSSSSSQGLGPAERLARGLSTVATSGPTQAEGSLLILDDVVTSGGTLFAAVEVARTLGWQDVRCYALAAAAHAESS